MVSNVSSSHKPRSTGGNRIHIAARLLKPSLRAAGPVSY